MHTDADGGVVRSVFVTSCGNFGLAGSSTGKIVMWNMQSGIRRREFVVRKLDVYEGENGEAAAVVSTNGRAKSKIRDRPITGIAVDPLNRTLVATTLEGTVNVSSLSPILSSVPRPLTSAAHLILVLRFPYYEARSCPTAPVSCGITTAPSGQRTVSNNM